MIKTVLDYRRRQDQSKEKEGTTVGWRSGGVTMNRDKRQKGLKDG